MKTTAPARTERPVQTFRCGRIQAAIWVNETARSTTRHNVTVTRSFKRTPESQWEQSNSFSREQALVAARLLQRAHDWINDEVARNGSTDDDPAGAAPPAVADANLDAQSEQCPNCRKHVARGTQRCDHCGSCVRC